MATTKNDGTRKTRGKRGCKSPGLCAPPLEIQRARGGLRKWLRIDPHPPQRRNLIRSHQPYPLHIGYGFSGCMEYRPRAAAALLRARGYGAGKAGPILRLLPDRQPRPEADRSKIDGIPYIPRSSKRACANDMRVGRKKFRRMHLESWLRGVIKANLANDDEFRAFAGKDSLGSSVTRRGGNVSTLQAQPSLALLPRYSSFYREFFRNAPRLLPDNSAICGICRDSRSPSPAMFPKVPIDSCAHPSRKLPDPILSSRPGPPVPKRKYSGLKTIWTGSRASCPRGSARSPIPATPCSFSFRTASPTARQTLLRQGVLKLGATPVVAGADLTANELMAAIEESGCKVIFGYTRKIFRLSKELERQKDLSRKGVAFLFLAAEYLPAAMRKELKRIWNCDIRTHYGLTEMGLGVAGRMRSSEWLSFQ